MAAARQAAEERRRRAPPAASSAQEDDADVAPPPASEPDPAPFVPYNERPSTRRAPTARVRTLQELPAPYTEAELDSHRQQTTAALRSATRSPDSALHALTTSLCLPSSVYAAHDASNDYFSQLESVLALFSDP